MKIMFLQSKVLEAGGPERCYVRGAMCEPLCVISRVDTPVGLGYITIYLLIILQEMKDNNEK